MIIQLKREKMSDLVRENSELGAEHNLPVSLVRDARFLRIQSSLVPNTIKTRRRSQDKVDVKKNIDNESPEGLEEAPD